MIRRYAAEFIGTFVIVFSPVALSATGKLPGGESGLFAAAWVSGLAVLAMVYALGPISAAHFNPAVTLGFALAKRFPWRFVPTYWLSQFLGAIFAAGVVSLLYGGGHGVHIPADPTGLLKNLATEALLTFMLMLVIIAVATDRRVSGTVPAIAIGLTVVFDVVIGGPITGGSMNPARSFGPALFGSNSALGSYWIYLLGPCTGASVAALVFESIRLEHRYTKGAPNELLEALHEVAEASH